MHLTIFIHWTSCNHVDLEAKLPLCTAAHVSKDTTIHAFERELTEAKQPASGDSILKFQG